MQEAVSTFQSVVEADEHNGGPKKKRQQAENENTSSVPNKKHETYKATKRQKEVKGHLISVVVEEWAEVCGGQHPEEGVICKGSKV